MWAPSQRQGHAHLRHVYAKLGVSRRTQLASRSDALTPRP
jgi:DNA-binding CsgD family transcriptional regulator